MITYALTIAGSDPTGGAGIQADLKTFAAMGVYGLSVITCLTAQSSSGIRGVHPVPPLFISSQLESLLEDFRINAFKIGMVYQRDIIKEIARLVRNKNLKNLVLDPLLSASSGGDLLKEEGIEVLKEELFPLATIVTPNLDEAGMLTGLNIKDLDLMREAARRIHAMGPGFVLIKGGHLEGQIQDLFFDGKTFIIAPMERISGEVHGTGCTLSAAITAGLAKGLTISEAIFKAQEYTRRVIKGAFSVGKGPKYPDHFVC
ncbi:MAG: bifunctional hydroxymethylpyrimidine kinase/phosphomethylpyrimidine kinase [bacterium]